MEITRPQTADAVSALYCLTYAMSPFPAKYLFADETSEAMVTLPWAYYLARVGDQYTLIDTGFSDAALAAAWGITLEEDAPAKLARLGVTPEMVRTVIITHGHFDHIGDLPHFPQATVYIARAAAEAYIAQPDDPAIVEILQHHARTVRIDAQQTIDDAFTFSVIGGHFVGSSVVSFTRQGQEYVLVGDECFVRANASELRPSGGLLGDPAANAPFLRDLHTRRPIILPCHDLGLATDYPTVAQGIVQIF